MKPTDAAYEGKLVIDNRDVAGVLERIADLLEFKDENPFKLRSYRVAAESIAEMQQPVADIAARGAAALQELPGIGKSLSTQIIEIIETGSASRVEVVGQIRRGCEMVDHVEILAGSETRGVAQAFSKLSQFTEIKAQRNDRVEAVTKKGVAVTLHLASEAHFAAAMVRTTG